MSSHSLTFLNLRSENKSYKVATKIYLPYKLRCSTRISSPEKSCNDTREKIRYFFHVFDIANPLLTRHSSFAPLGHVDEWTAKFSRSVAKKSVQLTDVQTVELHTRKKIPYLRAPMYNSLFQGRVCTNLIVKTATSHRKRRTVFSVHTSVWVSFSNMYTDNGVRSARSVRSVAPQLWEIVVTHEAEKIWTYYLTTDHARCYF